MSEILGRGFVGKQQQKYHWLKNQPCSGYEQSSCLIDILGGYKKTALVMSFSWPLWRFNFELIIYLHYTTRFLGRFFCNFMLSASLATGPRKVTTPLRVMIFAFCASIDSDYL